MKTKKAIVCGFFILILVLAFTACDDPTSNNRVVRKLQFQNNFL